MKTKHIKANVYIFKKKKYALQYKRNKQGGYNKYNVESKIQI